MEAVGERLAQVVVVDQAEAVVEMDRAIVIAARAIEANDPLFVMLARARAGYTRLRTDSRFLEIVARLNLPG